ncbi:MAG: 1,4-dihydroxy-6-naphthoate synthase [Desulfobulbaceae bacterium BRH_c16a]|nr:MAG: 1,4-dihydroxy-6-naphthoate synthase [Desulfobulbaceae bacterium BRH_c16a]
MNKDLSLGFSPCPNDTFIFYALVHGKIHADGLVFREPLLEDVEQLNMWALAGRLDVTKLSFHAFGHVQDEYCVLSAGSALGRGCGPLLVTAAVGATPKLSGRRIAIPGKLTTAALLLQMFLVEPCELVEMRFDRIIDAVCNGEVDAGVIIHESRFTYRERGLVCLQDLGEWWEKSVGLPIPLGCIAARRSLGVGKIRTIDRAIRASVDYAFLHPDRCLPYIRSKSQEMDAEVVRSHIGLYVNDFSRDLGEEGRAAITAFLQKGRQTGALPAGSRELFIG